MSLAEPIASTELILFQPKNQSNTSTCPLANPTYAQRALRSLRNRRATIVSNTPSPPHKPLPRRNLGVTIKNPHGRIPQQPPMSRLQSQRIIIPYNGKSCRQLRDSAITDLTTNRCPITLSARQLACAMKSHKTRSNQSVTLAVTIRLVGFENLCPIKLRREFNWPENDH